MMGLVSITHLLSASIPNSSSPSPSPSTASASSSCSLPSFSSSSSISISSLSTKRLSKLRLVKDAKGLEDFGDMTLGGMSSLPYGGSTLEEEERPGSSLSTASRSSRIPVLTRSHSLRVKSSSSSSSSTSHGQEGAKGSSKVAGKVRSEPRPNSRASPSVGKGLVRSASFVSSRGMKGLSSPPSPPSAHPSRHPTHAFTPDTARRAAAHSSTHARRTPTGASDRKSHSYAGMMGSPWSHHHYNHHHYNHHHHNNSSTSNHHYSSPYHHHLSSYSHHSKRPNFLPVSNATSSSSQYSSLPTTPASQPDTPSRSPDSNEVDDADSVKSFGSVSSAVSCDAALTHRHQGQGGVGSSRGVRSLKYVLHCRHNHEHDPEQYLTPTQRAARRIRELKAQLSEARREVQQRDTEIARLTRELVELRLLKARGPQWEEDEDEEDGARGGSGGKSAGKGEGVSVAPAAASTHTLATPKTTTSGTPSEGSEPELRRLMENMNAGAADPAAPQPPPSASPAGGSVAETTTDSVDLTRSSLADSGHYDDLTSPSLSSRVSNEDPSEANRGSARGLRTEEELVEAEAECERGEEEVAAEVMARSNSRGVGEALDPWVAVEVAEERLREEYLHREEVLKRNHMEEYHELKEKHNDRVEVLLSKLSDANLKYFELRPLYDQSQERVRELDRDVMRLKEELAEADLRHQKMYLQMFLKGQQAARIQAEDDLDGEEGLPSSSGPMMELMRQLTRTEEELEKVKGIAPPTTPSSLPFHTSPSSPPPPLLSSPGVWVLRAVSSSLGGSGAALVGGTKAIALYLQGRTQALYHREVNCRNNNNNNSTNNRRNGELDPEVTLQFLKSAIYYFFTDRDNAKGHLRAIESILGYSDSERYNIGKVIK
ncbi:protein quick-to-court-like isoform X3 [Eriocheir sinensis]|uniref:protein quick-to-court-like isoform X3 n=1 Tax=Eriocheir sinensis TaxID=95602 RepID=UPI0021C85CCA|nr:protein quick-to-court-like isoform X3 [Eriocheir sinensis]